MKVSTVHNTAKAAPDPDTGYPVNGAEEPTQGIPADDFSDKYFVESSTPESGKPADVEDADFLEHVAFYGPVPNVSKDQFAKVKVPTVNEIRGDAAKNKIPIDNDFCNQLKRNYMGLADRIRGSIKKLKDQQEMMPEISNVFQDVILERERALRRIDEELENVETLRASLVDELAQEMENLKSYGKEYYNWHEAYKSGGEYKGAKATMKNKPDPLKWSPPLDINGDARIGESGYYIASKTVDVEGEAVPINDVVNVDTKRAVMFDETGEPLATDGQKDPDFHWTISDNNLSYVDTRNNQIVLQIDSEEKFVAGNGMCETPIAINIPEYIRVDKDGHPIGIEQVGNAVQQTKADAESDWSLKRVVKVRIDSVPSSTTGEGFDYVVNLLGPDDIRTPMVSIRIKGNANISASKRAISLIAAVEKDDPKYKRMTGINIDAKKLHAEATFSLRDRALRKIKEEYDIDDPEKAKVFQSAIGNLQDSNAKTGLIVEGFTSAGIEGSKGNDWVFMNEAIDEDNEPFDKTGPNGEEIFSPQYTTAFNGGRGFNGLFHKKGNVLADQLGFFWGGQKDDNIYISVLHTEKVYINTRNTTGYTEIGNKSDGLIGSWGKDDDYYGIAAADYNFANIYEPDAEKYRIDLDIGPAPELTNGETAEEILASGKLDGYVPADADQIGGRVALQIDAHLESLKEDMLDNTDEDFFDFSDVEDYGSKAYAEMKGEADDFFAGWEQMMGSSLDDDDVMLGFDETLE